MGDRGFSISAHAAQRYIERIDGSASPDEARAAIRRHSRAIEVALGFGCKSVRLGSGAHIILDIEQGQVVTVYGPEPRIRNRHGAMRKFSFNASCRDKGGMEQ